MSNLNKGFDYSNLPKNNNKNPDGIFTNRIVPEVKFIEPIKLSDLVPLNNNYDHSYTFKVMFSNYFNGITVDQLLEWYSQKHTRQYKLNNKRNDWTEFHRY